MLLGHPSRCVISTSVPARRYGASESRTISSYADVPNGLQNRSRMDVIRYHVALRAVGPVVVRGGFRRGHAAGEAIRAEALEQLRAVPLDDLRREQLGRQR